MYTYKYTYIYIYTYVFIYTKKLLNLTGPVFISYEIFIKCASLFA